jgi:hypothetical protein
MIQSIAVTGMAAAAQSWSMLISAAIGEHGDDRCRQHEALEPAAHPGPRVGVALGDVVADLAGRGDLQRRPRDHHDDERGEQHGEVAVAGRAQDSREHDRETKR